MKNLKNVLLYYLKIILLCWVIYIISSQLLNILFYTDKPADGTRLFTPIYWSMHIIFFISYFIVHKRYLDKQDNFKPGEAFDLKKTIITFLREERLQINVLAAWAIINECMLFIPSNIKNIFATIMMFFLPSSVVIHIPIIRTLIAFSITLSIMIIADLILKYRNYVYWNKKQ